MFLIRYKYLTDCCP